MRMRMPDFKTPSKANTSWYDLEEDWPLIEASLAKQYGIRIRHNGEMPWTEFITLVAGLMPDTPLGQIVTIRQEKDPKIIKGFSADQRRIHSEWRKRQATDKLKDIKTLDKDMAAWEKTFALLYGGGEKK